MANSRVGWGETQDKPGESCIGNMEFGPSEKV
jgi:hypothetical protein